MTRTTPATEVAGAEPGNSAHRTTGPDYEYLDGAYPVLLPTPWAPRPVRVALDVAHDLEPMLACTYDAACALRLAGDLADRFRLAADRLDRYAAEVSAVLWRPTLGALRAEAAS